MKRYVTTTVHTLQVWYLLFPARKQREHKSITNCVHTCILKMFWFNSYASGYAILHEKDHNYFSPRLLFSHQSHHHNKVIFQAILSFIAAVTECYHFLVKGSSLFHFSNITVVY